MHIHINNVFYLMLPQGMLAYASRKDEEQDRVRVCLRPLSSGGARQSCSSSNSVPERRTAWARMG